MIHIHCTCQRICFVTYTISLSIDARLCHGADAALGRRVSKDSKTIYATPMEWKTELFLHFLERLGRWVEGISTFSVDARTSPPENASLPRPTPPTPGPSAMCAPTPTTLSRAPVPKLRRHPAHLPRGAICRPLHKSSRHPHGSTAHQPRRQCGQQKRHFAVARPPDPDPTHAAVPTDTPRSVDRGGQPGLTPMPESGLHCQPRGWKISNLVDGGGG